LPTAKPYATGEKNLVSARISYKKNWCHTSACIVGKCEWHEIYAIGLKVKALLCCLQLRSGSESGLARMNPMLDFAAATFLMSSETNEAIQRCFTIIDKHEHSRCELLHSVGPWQLRNACRCAHQPAELITKRYLDKVMLQNRKLCLPSIQTSVGIIRSNL